MGVVNNFAEKRTDNFGEIEAIILLNSSISLGILNDCLWFDSFFGILIIFHLFCYLINNFSKFRKINVTILSIYLRLFIIVDFTKKN